MIVGLYSGTHSKMVVIIGIILIAISDAMSDALGVHIAEESAVKNTARDIWEATGATFVSKLVFSSTFMIPFFLPFSLNLGVILCLVWGASLIIMFSIYLARKRNMSPWHIVLEHLLIAMAVVLVTHFVGDWVGGLSINGVV